MLNRVLQVIRTVVKPGRFFPPNPTQESPKTSVSSEDLRQVESEDAMVPLQSLFKEGSSVGGDYGVPTAIAPPPTVGRLRGGFVEVVIYAKEYHEKSKELLKK